MDKELLKAKLKDFIIDNVYVDNKNIVKSEIIKNPSTINSIYKDELLYMINENFDLDECLINDTMFELCEVKYLEDKGEDNDYFYFTSKGYRQHINIITFESEYNNRIKQTRAEKNAKNAKIISYLALVLPILYILFEQIIIKIF